MKRFFLVLMCLCILTSICLAQEVVSDNKQIVGGYTKVPVNGKDVTDALSYLKNNFPAIGINSVEQAYTQVVAGVNFKLICKVTQAESKEMWEMIVYRDLKNEYHFTGARRVKK